MAAVVILGLLFFVKQDFKTVELAINSDQSLTAPLLNMEQVEKTETKMFSLEDESEHFNIVEEKEKDILKEADLTTTPKGTLEINRIKMDRADDISYMEMEEVREIDINFSSVPTTNVPPRPTLMDDELMSKSAVAVYERKVSNLDKAIIKKKEIVTSKNYSDVNALGAGHAKEKAEAENKEVIIPKTLHINQTTELNRLFYIIGLPL